MGKDKRVQLHQCMRCRIWLDDDSELCAKCEVEYLTEIEPVLARDRTWMEQGTDEGNAADDRHMREHGLGFHGGLSPEAFRATHGGGLQWSEPWDVVSGTFVEYDDPLDQARADSMVGE